MIRTRTRQFVPAIAPKVVGGSFARDVHQVSTPTVRRAPVTAVDIQSAAARMGFAAARRVK